MPIYFPADTVWPPKDRFDTYNRYAEHSAWYGGDVQDLAAYYGGPLAINSKPKGLANIVRSWFWGKQAIAPSTRIRIHVPIGGDISATSADLLFGSGLPEFKADNKAAQARLDAYAESFAIAAIEGAEVASALGGVFPRLTWDKSVVDDMPIITMVHPDAAIPDFRFGHLVAVTFWEEVAEVDGYIYRHLERHEPGKIYHALYKGSKDRLGAIVPLSEIDATADFAELVDQDGAIDTGITRLTAAYVPNMLPNRTARGSNLGRSDYAGAEGLMDALDEAMTSWIRDLRNGAGRLIVPAEFTRTLPGANTPGTGAWFDMSQEIFVPLEGMSVNDLSDPIKVSQFEIRTQEHHDTVMALIERIVSTGGYSAGSFGLDVQKKEAQTATEIESRERRSFLTRDKKARLWTPALRHIAMAALELDKAAFNNGPGAVPVSVTFGPAVRETGVQTATAVELAARATAISTYLKVKRLNPEMDEADIQAEVKRIQDDQKALLPDLSSFAASSPNGDNPKEKQPAPAAK